MTASPYLRIGLVLAAMLAAWLLIAWLGRLQGEGYTLAGHVQNAVLATLLTVPAVALVRRRLDGGTLAGLGLRLAPGAAARDLAIGAAAFLVPFSIGLAAVLALGWTRITPLAPLGEIAGFVPVLIALVFLYEALPEELVFRGYVYRTLAERHARIVAVVAQAVLFGLWGMLLWTVSSGALALDRLALFTAIAFVFGLVRAITGSVWTTIGLHTAFQAVAQLLLHAGRGHFAVEGAEMLQLVALGIVPFSLATLIVEAAYRRRTAWRERETGPA